MRLFVLSDLHLEKGPRPPLRAAGAAFDVLVCAGDIHEGQPERGMAVLAEIADGRPTVVVPGNHDRYRSGPDDPRAAADLVLALRAAAARYGNVSVLEAGEQVEIDGVGFVGATLWTDWSLAGLWRPQLPAAAATAAAVAAVTDRATGSREYGGALVVEDRIWDPAAAAAAHRRDRACLRRGLERAGARTRVAVTHHAPLTEILEPYREAPGVPWWIPAFYASTMLADLPEELRPDLWVSGHFHAAHDLTVGRTRCVANPVAAANYDPSFVVEPATR